MRYWFDTEFIERGANHPIDLISMGIVAEDGREFYAESTEADLSKASDWVQENVVSHLWSHQPNKREGNVWSRDGGVGGLLSRRHIASEIITFCDPERYGKPELWAYYADYDWVVLCQLFGTMMDLPDGWPKWCRDIKQLCDNLGNPKLPEQDGGEHHALADARWNKSTWEWLEKHQGSLALAAPVKSDVD